MSENTGFNAEALVKAAKGGDTDAMYRMSSLLGAEGHTDQAVNWLKQAASNGHGDARFTLATFYLKGVNLERNVSHAVSVLEAAVKTWHMPSVQLYTSLLAQGAGVERNWTQAVDLLIMSIEKGHSPAMVELAFLLMMAQAQDGLVHNLMIAAACRKNLHAGLYIASTVTDNSTEFEKSVAAYWIAKAMEMGHPTAGFYEHLAGASSEPIADLFAVPNFDHDVVKTSLGKLALWTPKNAETIIDRPNARKIETAIPAPICEYLIAVTMPRLQPASEYDPEAGEWVAHSQCRGNLATFWQEDHNLVTYAVADRMAKAVGAAHDFAEQFNVVAFPTGGEYLPRYDYVNPEFPGASENLTTGGQCIYTVQLTILPADEGGETAVGASNELVETSVGDMIMVKNVLDDREPDDQAIITERPVLRGQKWIAMRLIREKQQIF